MKCKTLEELRALAHQMSLELGEKRRKARDSGSGAPSDYENFLMRKLEGAKRKIQQHVAEHGCENGLAS